VGGAAQPERVKSKKAYDPTARYMDNLMQDAIREIEQIHSSWIAFEVAGQNHRLVTLCAEDIELWPPDAQPVLGRAAVSAQLERGTVKIHDIKIINRRVRGSNEIAYLTASYKTTFSSADESTRRQTRGSHLWILKKQAGRWFVKSRELVCAPTVVKTTGF
jgi:ketosteroid isomerase-like protein